MNKSLYIVIVILCAHFGFSTASAQQILKSTSQKQCQWNINTEKEENCVEKVDELIITIDQTKERIQISHPVGIDLFKILKTEKETNGITYNVVSAAGLGKTIIYNKSEGWLKISDQHLFESSVVLYYNINKQ